MATTQLSRSAALEAWKVCFWPATLKRNSLVQAKAEKETITSSEGYKAELEKLTKPAVAVAAAKKLLLLSLLLLGLLGGGNGNGRLGELLELSLVTLAQGR
jgi:hypothetical protein